jgi:uncharacterized protein with PIN domain
MAVHCPGCERAYDSSLFGFGRTIQCACGRTIGREERIPVPQTDAPRFVADAMLGALARWLRILGFDTVFDTGAADEALVRRAIEEGRFLLTRDRGMARDWRFDGILIVDTEDPLDQLRAVADRVGFAAGEGLFTRCPRCNTPLSSAKPSEVRDQVPAGVLERQNRFARCPGCGHVYWEGSHTAGIRERLRRLFDETRS